MKRQKRNLSYQLFVAALIAGISGCGNESGNESDDNKISQHIVIETRAALDEASVDSLTTIDLSNAVKTEENIDLRLESITPLSEHNECIVQSMKGLKYTVETDVSQVCRFEYTVIPMEAQYSGKAYGTSEVLVSDNGSDRIAPIAKQMTQGQILLIDIEPYLPIGAQLDPTSLELRGVTDSGELGEAVAINNTIEYTAPNNTFGQAQIYYTALDNSSGMLYSGIIYIAISLDANTAPIADKNSELEALYMSDIILGGRNINVESYVNDPDGDTLQLIDVYTATSGWAKVLPNSTSFFYTPNEVGMHNITYVVSDRRGGLAIGTLYFEVETYRSIYDSVNNKTFLPTLTFSELEDSDGVFTSISSEDGSKGKAGNYPIFSRSLAEAYCITKGTILPTTAELVALFNGELEGQAVWSSEYKWPAGSSYMTSDGSVSLFNGAITTDSAGYFSCAQKDFSPTEYSFVKSHAQADFGSPFLVTASATYNGNEFILPEEKYDLQVGTITTNPPALESLVEVSIDKNRVTIDRTNDSVKTASVKISDPSVQGAIDELVLVAGVTECPADVSVLDTQTLGCVPVIYEVTSPEGNDSTEAFTVALSDTILERLGLDLYQDQPSYFRSSNSIPNYTYLDPIEIFDVIGTWQEYEATAQIHQRLCDIYNENAVAGRQNWAIGSTRSDYNDIVIDPIWGGTLAYDFTMWMSAETGRDVSEIGQGHLVNNLGNVRQNNQYSDLNKGHFQGGLPYEDYKQWQFLTCWSPH